jgi:hypothetical protein
MGNNLPTTKVVGYFRLSFAELELWRTRTTDKSVGYFLSPLAANEAT